MGRNGSVDMKDFIKLQQQLQDLEKEYDVFIETCSKEIAARLLRILIKNTIVGDYPKESGKKGGTLRRGWTTAQKEGITVVKSGNTYTFDIKNSVEYASYVEFGHRKRGKKLGDINLPGKGWVEGKFTLTLAEKEIEKIAPPLLEKRIKQKLSEVMK